MASQQEIEAAKKRFLANNYRDTRKFIETTDKFSSLDFSKQFAKDVFILANEFISQQSRPIDETTHVPAFIGAEEIEIGGVTYVRKDLRKSQSVNEQLLTAARRLLRELCNYLGGGPHEAELAMQTAEQAIAAAEAEIAEREKPVTEEWLRLFGCPLTNRLRLGFVAIPEKLSVFPPCGHLPSAVQFFDHITVDVHTRGDVLDLMRLLGGAK